jgi:predicted Zn finger-like uncharacterized protein
LIITCAKCATQFQLDESRVPETGIRVRCSVCKHAFFVEHPDDLLEEASDELTDAVEAALAAESGEVPEPSQDLEPPLPDPAPPGAGARDEGPEGSWEFSDGGRLSEAASRSAVDPFEESFDAAREAVDALLGEPGPAPQPTPERAWSPPREVGPSPSLRGATELFAEDPEPEPPELPELPEAPEPPEALEVPDAPEPGPGDEDLPIPLADDPWEVPAWTDAAPGAPDIDSEPASDLGPGADEPLEIDGDVDPSAAALDAGPDPFEDDLAGTGGLAPEAPSGWGLGDAPDAEAEHLELEREPRAVAPAARSALVAGPDVPLGLEPRRRSGALLAWLTRIGDGLGSTVVALLAAVALWGSAAPRLTPPVQAGSQALAGLEATGIAGRWVEHAILGSLYVVSGELHNAGTQPKAPGARLVVRLLDARGQPLEAAGASLAPPVGAVWLREADPAQLRAVREEGARYLARSALAPGARVAFEAVFEALPHAARRFDLAAEPSRRTDPQGS